MDVEVASQTGQSRFERRLATLVGVAALVASLLATMESKASGDQDRALMLAARYSVQVSESTAGSAPFFVFSLSAQQTAIGQGLKGAARNLASLRAGPLAGLEQALAQADSATSTKALTIAGAMARVPTEEDGLDRHTAELLKSGLGTAFRVVELQNEEVDSAEALGRQADRAVFALSMLAAAAVLLGLAGVVGEGPIGKVGLWLGGFFLLASSGLGLFTFLS